MSEEALKQLDEQLKCSICLDAYTDPKLLQCFHVFCRQCLVPLVVRDQQGQLSLTCPVCRHVTLIPAIGVAGLQPAFHINRLLEIQASLRKDRTPAATPESTVKHHIHCFEHPEEESKLYCETCENFVCLECALKGGKHHDHDCKQFHQAFVKYKKAIMSSLEPMESQVATTERALARLDARYGEIADQRAATEDNIHSTFRRLQEFLDGRETQLIIQLHQVTEEKLKRLEAQREQIETVLAQLNSCLHFVKECLRPGNEGDALMMKASALRQMEEITTSLHSDKLEPSAEADIEFSALISVFRDFGRVKCLGDDEKEEAKEIDDEKEAKEMSIETLVEILHSRQEEVLEFIAINKHLLENLSLMKELRSLFA